MPAKSARIGLIDKLFTRVGASDNISMGESTFMVEMNETASILNNVSERSLVLLDEIGRGTSTYDGISIAWAISEYLHEHPSHAKTLFATHYHELNEMTETFDRIKNYNVSVKELKDNVLFLRTLVKGGSHHSFGIHVAKMAGMPPQVLHRAQQILKQLEKSHSSDELTAKVKDLEGEMQLSFFNLDDPMLEALKTDIEAIDIDTLTPVEALMKLNEIKRMLTKKKSSIKSLKKLCYSKNCVKFAPLYIIVEKRSLKNCESSSGVEHHLAKVGVASSNLVFRSDTFLKHTKMLKWWNW